MASAYSSLRLRGEEGARRSRRERREGEVSFRGITRVGHRYPPHL